MSFAMDIAKILKAEGIDYKSTPIYDLHEGMTNTGFRFAHDQISQRSEHIKPIHGVGAIPSDIAIIVAPCVEVDFEVGPYTVCSSGISYKTFYFSVCRDEPNVIRGRESDFDPDLLDLLKKKDYIIK